MNIWLRWVESLTHNYINQFSNHCATWYGCGMNSKMQDFNYSTSQSFEGNLEVIVLLGRGLMGIIGCL